MEKRYLHSDNVPFDLGFSACIPQGWDFPTSEASLGCSGGPDHLAVSLHSAAVLLVILMVTCGFILVLLVFVFIRSTGDGIRSSPYAKKKAVLLFT